MGACVASFFCLETEPEMKTKDLMWAAFASGLGVIGALIAIKFLGVDQDLPGFSHAANALDQ